MLLAVGGVHEISIHSFSLFAALLTFLSRFPFAAVNGNTRTIGVKNEDTKTIMKQVRTWWSMRPHMCGFACVCGPHLKPSVGESAQMDRV